MKSGRRKRNENVFSDFPVVDTEDRRRTAEMVNESRDTLNGRKEEKNRQRKNEKKNEGRGRSSRNRRSAPPFEGRDGVGGGGDKLSRS